MSMTDLETLHIRMPSQTEEFAIVQEIISVNPHLRDVAIEADCALSVTSFPRAVFDMDKISDSRQTYDTFDRFVLRAPSIEVVMNDTHSFLRRLRGSHELRIAAYKFNTHLPGWQWVLTVMQHLPTLSGLEIAHVFENTKVSPVYVNLVTADLPNLLDLTLELPEGDARLLRLVHAPILRFLRVRTLTCVDAYGACPELHFPSLVFVNVWCSRPVGVRFSTLGIPWRTYRPHLTRTANDRDDYSGPFPAWIGNSPEPTNSSGHLASNSSAIPGPPSAHTILRVMPIFITETPCFASIAHLWEPSTTVPDIARFSNRGPGQLSSAGEASEPVSKRTRRKH
ncbi:hypothetical protein CF319_g7627 [Tilletia indica]|nr:hypothetical protein CF319_g7627 [Tilletia indica]